MEPEGSLPCSQELANCPYTEPNESIHIPKSNFPNIHSNLVPHLHLFLHCVLLPSGLATKMLYAPITDPRSATCPAHLIFLALITLTILGEENKPCSSSLCSYNKPPVTSSIFDPNILRSPRFQMLSISMYAT
jgi:hypothetical protein